MDGLTWLPSNADVRCLLGGGSSEWPLEKPRLNATGWLGTTVVSSSVSALDLIRCLLGGGAVASSSVSASTSPAWLSGTLVGIDSFSLTRVRFECTLGDRGCRPRRDRDRDRDRSVPTGSLAAALALAASNLGRNKRGFTSKFTTREGGGG